MLSKVLADEGFGLGTSRVFFAIGSSVGDIVLGAFDSTGLGPAVEIEEPSLDVATRLAKDVRSGSPDAVVGIGGGGTLDVAKWAASSAGVPFVSVATTLTHDGLASPIASLDDDGWKASHGVQPPVAVIVDLDLVQSAPMRHSRSGVGEVVSNLSAVADWVLARDVGDEPFDGVAAAIASVAATSVLNDPTKPPDDRSIRLLAESLILSGLAMTVAGTSRPCSGACHEISHAIDRLFPGQALHGEQVAVGAMFSSFLRNDPQLSAIDACFRRRGVPRLPSDIELTVSEFCDAVALAPDTRPGRLTILEFLELDRHAVRRKVDEFVDTYA